MCGICCVLSPAWLEINIEQIKKTSTLQNRGPDFHSHYVSNISDDFSIHLFGFVLHLRGNGTQQPVGNENKDQLLWNGEIFGGYKIDEECNDTEFLYGCLSDSSEPCDIIHTLARVQGPWSFIFWQAKYHRLWFGRDVFGRRSLLWHLPENESDVFCLSSVQVEPWRFSEIPSVGIFCLQFSDNTSNTLNSKPELTLYPWPDVVWPGTTNLVTSTSPDSLKQHLYTDHTYFNVGMDTSLKFSTWMPTFNSELPSSDWSVPSCDQTVTNNKESMVEYLRNLTENNEVLRKAARQFVNLLQTAVKIRSYNLPRVKKHCQEKHVCTPSQYYPDIEVNDIGETVTGDCVLNNESSSVTKLAEKLTIGENEEWSNDVDLSEENLNKLRPEAHVAVLFSGGIDSTVIAALADRVIPPDESIDLLNVAFEQAKNGPLKKNEKKQKTEGSQCQQEKNFDVPDRLTGYTALSELNPKRIWNFIEINVTKSELQEFRCQRVSSLIYPLNSVLDDSIGCAVWFAARGEGIVGNGPNRGMKYKSSAKVILCGMGADEQLAGYSRHRSTFRDKGWSGILKETELEITRISARNLGRDDRIIADHGKESRIPFLDEQVVSFLASLPMHLKADLSLPRGLGEKLVLRVAALELGLSSTAVLPKRAIQFGSRIAKMENRKEKASDVCTRLTDQ